jgi:hypothetical protein
LNNLRIFSALGLIITFQCTKSECKVVLFNFYTTIITTDNALISFYPIWYVTSLDRRYQTSNFIWFNNSLVLPNIIQLANRCWTVKLYGVKKHLFKMWSLYINIHFTIVETKNNLVLHIMPFYLHAVPTVKQQAQHRSQNTLTLQIFLLTAADLWYSRRETHKSVITYACKWLLKLAATLQSIQEPFSEREFILYLSLCRVTLTTYS